MRRAAWESHVQEQQRSQLRGLGLELMSDSSSSAGFLGRETRGSGTLVGGAGS